MRRIRYVPSPSRQVVCTSRESLDFGCSAPSLAFVAFLWGWAIYTAAAGSSEDMAHSRLVCSVVCVGTERRDGCHGSANCGVVSDGGGGSGGWL